VKSFVEKKVDTVIKEMDIVKRMPLLHAQWAVTLKSLQQKLQYVFRCTPCGDRTVYLDLAAKYDEAILSVLQRICHNKDLSKRARAIAYLPQTMGGFGLRSWFDIADAAYLASTTYAATILPGLLHKIKDCFAHPSFSGDFCETRSSGSSGAIDISGSTPPAGVAEETMAASARLGVSTNLKSVERTRNGKSLGKICADLTAFGDARALSNLVSSLEASEDPMAVYHLAHRTSAAGDQYTWSTVPCDEDTTLENAQIKVAAQQRLLEPIIINTNKEEDTECAVTCPKCGCECGGNSGNESEVGDVKHGNTLTYLVTMR
jgi:hypothetical protein